MRQNYKKGRRTKSRPVIPASRSSIREAAGIIRNGGLVAFPTETVYGLGADAFNEKAAARIFEVKNRPQFDPLIVHVADYSDLSIICSSVDRRAEKLMKRFWPGPLTLVLSKAAAVPPIVTAGLSTVAVRMPDHAVALELIRQSRSPIAAPSANPFGYLSPTAAAHVKAQLGERVDLILDGGACSTGLESTIIDLTEEKPRLLRPGGLPIEAIEEITGRLKIGNGRLMPKAPGQFPSHYSPRTRLQILNKDESILSEGKKAGLLAFSDPLFDISHFAEVEILSSDGDLKEAASGLFSALHRLDKANLDVIYAQTVPENGLGLAIMDRLRRAQHRF